MNWLLSQRSQGAKHHKRSRGQQPSESEEDDSGLAIAAWALLDSIPESIVIGLSMLKGGCGEHRHRGRHFSCRMILKAFPALQT